MRLQEQVIGMDANIYRHGDRLRDVLAATERLRDRLLPVIHAADWHELVKCHETIATCFTTELMYRAALCARGEPRLALPRGLSGPRR